LTACRMGILNWQHWMRNKVSWFTAYVRRSPWITQFSAEWPWHGENLWPSVTFPGASLLKRISYLVFLAILKCTSCFITHVAKICHHWSTEITVGMITWWGSGLNRFFPCTPLPLHSKVCLISNSWGCVTLLYKGVSKSFRIESITK